MTVGNVAGGVGTLNGQECVAATLGEEVAPVIGTDCVFIVDTELVMRGNVVVDSVTRPVEIVFGTVTGVFPRSAFASVLSPENYIPCNIILEV